MEDYEREIESKVKPFKPKFFGKYIKKLEDEPILRLPSKRPQILPEINFDLPVLSHNKKRKREIFTVRTKIKRIFYEKIGYLVLFPFIKIV